ncbi:MAG: metallophosphoesterase [Thermoguttaceae bacterium]|nr:metallophosphoesterase [Thermoguttaceae bacterium]
MNRRDFLRAVAVATVSSQFVDIGKLLAEDVPIDENIVAIFSDVHLYGSETVQQVVRFNQSVCKVLAMNPRPANLLIYGDVAYDQGTVENYELFRELIKPIEAAGINWEVAMGNHDRLENFRQVFPQRFERKALVEGRYVNIVETPHADFILLDSYLKGQVRGEISPEQREWLVQTLKKYDDKPVFVGCHHHLADTKIGDVLKACPGFVAYLHGHLHYYRTPVQEEIKTICFPSVGHWGDMGFMTARLTDKEATFVPDLDAYQWSKYGYVKEPEKDVESYLKALNENSPTFAFS